MDSSLYVLCRVSLKGCRCRYLLYLSTLSSGASAADDLRPAVAALARLPQQVGSHSQQHSSENGSGGPGRYDPRPAALLSVYYCQNAAAPAPPAVSGATVVASGRVNDHESSTSCHPPADPLLPANVAVCGPPDGHIGCAAAVADAESLFRRLFPELPGLMAALGSSAGAGADPGGGDSDDEALDALASALKGLGEGPAS